MLSELLLGVINVKDNSNLFLAENMSVPEQYLTLKHFWRLSMKTFV